MAKLHHTDRYLTEADFRLMRAIGQAAVVMLAAIPAAGVAAMAGLPALFLLVVEAIGLALMALVRDCGVRDGSGAVAPVHAREAMTG